MDHKDTNQPDGDKLIEGKDNNNVDSRDASQENITQPAKQERKGRLLRSGIIVSSMTLLSRIFGLTRDMVIAYFFGAGSGADAFFLAFRIPNFFRRLFAEGSFSQAFVPVLSDYKTNRSHQEVKDLVARTSGSLGISLIAITIFGVLGAEVVISVFAAGFVYTGDVDRFTLATDMLRLTFPYLFLISMTALAGALLNTYERFAVPAFTPVLLNLSLIVAAVVLRPHLAEPVMALAWGVLIAGVAQLTFQLPFLARANLLVMPKVDFRDPGVKRILTLMLPAIFGVSVSQINLLLDTVIASLLQTGSLSWLYYADRLLELPLALFGITIATVILPGLSKEHASASPGEFSATLNWSMKLVILFGVPATAALILLAEELIATLFYQGEITPLDVSMSGLALAAYGCGLLGHMMIKVLAPGYFAREDTRTPVRYGVVALTTNMVLNLILVWHFKHVGLALATSLAAFLNAALLFQGLYRAGTLVLAPDWAKYLLQVGISVSLMSVTLVIACPSLDVWLSMDFFMRLGYMLLLCGAGALIYAASLLLMGFRFKALVR